MAIFLTAWTLFTIKILCYENVMTRKKLLISIAVAIWLLGAIYLAPRAIEELRLEMIEELEGRSTSDPWALWKSMRGIMMPSLLLEDAKDLEQ